MKKVLLFAALTAIGISVYAQDTYVGQPTADTWVRSNSINAKGNSAKNLEIKTWSGSDPATNFYALMQFEFTAPSMGNQVKSAVLRLTTRYKKGDSEVKVFALDYDVEEGSTDYEKAGTAIEAAIAGEPIAVFNLKGDGSKAPTDAISDDYKTVDKWQNTIDLSSYVRSLTTNKFAIVFQKSMNQNNSSQIYSKEATDETLQNDAGTFAAADLVPQLTVEYQEATDIHSVVKGSVADLWVWSGTHADETKGGNTVELRTNGDDKMYGLISFAFDAPAANEIIQSASLRLVTRFKKGDSQTNVYGYGADIDESATTYNNAIENITAALANDPIATFKAKGCAQWAPTDKNVTEEYTTVEAWTNIIDVTDYIKTLTSNKLVILLEKPYEQNNSTQFWTKEATDISNHEESAFSYTFTAADLVPQLIVTYKDTGATAISDVKVENFKVAEGAYTLSGQRVTKPTKGLYIVNGKKVVIK